MTVETIAVERIQRGKPMKITKQVLKQYVACPRELKLFNKVFPLGVAVSRRNMEKAVNAGLDVEWLMSNIVRPYGNSWRSYCAKVDSRWQAFFHSNAFPYELDSPDHIAHKKYLKSILPEMWELYKKISKAQPSEEP
jgi:hypothetical protein